LLRRHFDRGGNPRFFDRPRAINAVVLNGLPIRLPYSGEASEHNGFRGDGYLDLDGGLAKSWQLREYGAPKLS
jgi:hypothetical protein